MCGEVGRGHILWKNSGKFESGDVNQSECESPQGNDGKCQNFLGVCIQSSQRTDEL